jgi:hypothetical protein
MQKPVYLVLVQYRTDSKYKDAIGHSYHFPKKYFNQMNQRGAEFIYYEPVKGKGEYFGFGELGNITPDPNASDFFFADILNYRPFEEPVFREDEEGNLLESGELYNAQNAVRRIDPQMFENICKRGGLDFDEEGVDAENPEDELEPIINPFDPSKIKVDREPQSVFQVLRKISLGEIRLDPDFQRNLVWDPVRRSRLIESLLLRIPLPAFYFDGVDGSTWQVVDGLQRLSTLRDFITEKNFALSGLEYLISVEGMKFDQLPRGMQRELEETQVTLFIIRPDTPPEVKFTIFYRINTGGLVLTAQEIRHALFQGKATKLLADLARSDEFLAATTHGVGDVRMEARECILRYLAFRLNSFTDYSKPDLNSLLSGTMKQLNSLDSKQEAVLRRDFREAMNRAHEVFGRWAFRKFDPAMTRRGPVNKALFESWANVLLHYDRTKLVERKDTLCAALANEFMANGDYALALSAGTGGLRAVKERFTTARAIVEKVLA